LSKGPLLTDWEIRRAAQLRMQKLTWAVISERLGRDRGGLARAIRKRRLIPIILTRSLFQTRENTLHNSR
jgi:hypothetical protein